MNRFFLNILSDDIEATATFYQQVFGMQRHFDSDWFVILNHAEMPAHELGILKRDAEIVPDTGRGPFGGGLVTLVVEDCDTTFERATLAGAEVVEPPKLMPYGQRRALVRDPAGALLDISSPA
ncbi:MAG: VOC family protein [Pseudomonadota bacterium]